MKPSTVEEYLKAAASFATAAHLPDPRFSYDKYGMCVSKNYFPALQTWMNFLKKWDGPTEKAWSLDMTILAALEKMAAPPTQPTSELACAIDAIVLGSYTGARCSEYCKGTVRKGEPFATVPSNHYTREWGGFPIAFIAQDLTFLCAKHTVLTPDQAPLEAEYVSIRFRFDKGGGQNFSVRHFKRMPSLQFFCPVKTALRSLSRWRRLGSDQRFPLFCFHQRQKGVQAIVDSKITHTIRTAVRKAYPDPSHTFRHNIHLFRTHSVRVFACCTLIAAGLSDAQIEHKLRWSSDAWKTYIRESFAEVDKTSFLLFKDAHVTL